MAGFIIDRTLGIGGSDVAAILGLSRYRNALHVYLEKRKELPGEEPKDNEEGKLFGTLCEAVAAKVYAERTGRKVWRPSRSFVHPSLPFVRGNLDRLQHGPTRKRADRGAVEIKWLDASRRSVWVNEGVPEGYYLQLQHYMLVTGLRWGTFVVVFGGNKLEYFDVDRDEPLIARLVEVETEFWDRVVQGNPPDITFDELGKNLLKRLYPAQVVGKEMIMDDEEAKAKARRLFTVEATIKQRQADALGLEVWFKEKMADVEKLLVPGVATFTWKSQSSNRIDIDKFRAEQPAMSATYTVTKPSRVFRKKNAEEEVAELVPDEMIVFAPQAARRITFDD